MNASLRLIPLLSLALFSTAHADPTALPTEATKSVPASSAKWEPDIRRFEDADHAHPPEKDAVLFVGSSSIVKWTSLEKDFAGTKVLNRGFGGSDLSDSTAFASRIIAPYQPRLIFLYAGDNDLANGKTADTVFSEFQDFVKTVRALLPKTRIGFIAIKPSPSRIALLPKVISANEMIKAAIAKDPSLFYVDIFTPMLDKDKKPRPELFTADMLHMNPQGYAIWKDCVMPLLK